MSVLHDSGKRESYSTGGQREPNDGRGRFDLIPDGPMLRVAKHFENGVNKYGERNWEKGLPLIGYLNAAARHLNKLANGKDGEDHAAAVVWNMLCYMETLERIIESTLPQELADKIHPLVLQKIFDNKNPNICKEVKNTSAETIYISDGKVVEDVGICFMCKGKISTNEAWHMHQGTEKAHNVCCRCHHSDGVR